MIILVPTQNRHEEECIVNVILVIVILPLPGDSNKVSGPSSSAVVSTDSGDDGNLEDKQVPRFNGDERDGENNSDFFGAGSLDTGNTSDSGISTCIPFLKCPSKYLPS